MHVCAFLCVVMDVSWIFPGISSGHRCPAFCGATPTAGGFLNREVCSYPALSYANSILLQSQQPDHPRYSVERHRLGGPIPSTTAASTQIRAPQSLVPLSLSVEPTTFRQGRQHDANTSADAGDDGAERMFATARALHLRRHRSPASRGLALKLFRETLRRRPAWKETDSRFAVESGIDEVFKSFSCQHQSACCTADTKAVDNDLRCLRTTLAQIGYTARTMQERFGVAGGQRLPGPYYLRKSFDHRNVRHV